MSSSRSFFKNCKRATSQNRGALEQGLRDKWRAGITEAQIVDAVEIDLLQPTAEECWALNRVLDDRLLRTRACWRQATCRCRM